MKHLATCLFLILLGIHCQAQKLQLKLEGNTILETKILDSISYPKVHLDVKSIETETNSILEKLSKLGYLERKLIALNKINDTNHYFAKNQKKLLMKEQRIRPYRLSKYCLGSVEIYGEDKLKFNRFKKKLLYLKKINHDAI